LRDWRSAEPTANPSKSSFTAPWGGSQGAMIVGLTDFVKSVRSTQGFLKVGKREKKVTFLGYAFV